MEISICEKCENLKRWSEAHPWGSTVAFEYFEECLAEADEWQATSDTGKPVFSCTSFEPIQEEVFIFE